MSRYTQSHSMTKAIVYQLQECRQALTDAKDPNWFLHGRRLAQRIEYRTDVSDYIISSSVQAQLGLKKKFFLYDFEKNLTHVPNTSYIFKLQPYIVLNPDSATAVLSKICESNWQSCINVLHCIMMRHPKDAQVRLCIDRQCFGVLLLV